MDLNVYITLLFITNKYVCTPVNIFYYNNVTAKKFVTNVVLSCARSRKPLCIERDPQHDYSTRLNTHKNIFHFFVYKV